MKKFCVILQNNTAELDFLLPILDKCKNNFDIIILDYNKNIIAYKGSLWINFFGKKTKILSLNNLTKKNKLMDCISKRINSNSVSIKKILNLFFFNKNFNGLLFISFYNYVYKIFLNTYFFYSKINYDFSQYEYILTGQRDFKNKIFSIKFEEIIKNYKKKIILIPHGPHYDLLFPKKISATEKIIVDLNKDFINIYPNKYQKPWLNKYLNKKRCLLFNYPMLNDPKSINLGYAKKKFKTNYKKKILIISRSFDIYNSKRTYDQFTSNVDEFMDFLKPMKNIIGQGEFDVFLKPHPKTDLNLLRHVLSKNSMNNIKIINDSIFFFINKIDYIYSYQSTSMLFGVPFSKIIFKYIDNYSKNFFTWKMCNKFYSGFTEVTKHDCISNIIKNLGEKKNNQLIKKNKKKILDMFRTDYKQNFFKLIK